MKHIASFNRKLVNPSITVLGFLIYNKSNAADSNHKQAN